jgi:hypothetical protein
LFDLTAKFKEANERREYWGEKLFQSPCADIAGGIESAVVRLTGIRELVKSGQVPLKKSVVAIVQVKLPPLFASNAYKAYISKLARSYLAVFQQSTLYALRLNYWAADMLNYDRISIIHLWYAAVCFWVAELKA